MQGSSPCAAPQGASLVRPKKRSGSPDLFSHPHPSYALFMPHLPLALLAAPVTAVQSLGRLGVRTLSRIASLQWLRKPIRIVTPHTAMLAEKVDANHSGRSVRRGPEAAYVCLSLGRVSAGSLGFGGGMWRIGIKFTTAIIHGTGTWYYCLVDSAGCVLCRSSVITFSGDTITH